jgi:hypothetical protein
LDYRQHAWHLQITCYKTKDQVGLQDDLHITDQSQNPILCSILPLTHKQCFSFSQFRDVAKLVESYIFKPNFGQNSPAKKSLFTTVVFEELISISVCFSFFLVLKFWRIFFNEQN